MDKKLSASGGSAPGPRLGFAMPPPLANHGSATGDEMVGEVPWCLTVKHKRRAVAAHPPREATVKYYPYSTHGRHFDYGLGGGESFPPSLPPLLPPFLPPSLPFHFPSLPSPPLAFPSLPLEVGPLLRL